MPNEGEAVIFEFDFEGKTTAKTKDQEQLTGAEEDSIRRKEEDIVKKLNRPRYDSYDFATNELRQVAERVFQPLASGSVTAEVEIEFRYESNKSVIAVGEILVGLAPFASAVAVQALAPNLANLIKAGATHVFRRLQRRQESNPFIESQIEFEPFTVNVFPREIQLATAQPIPEPNLQRGQQETVASSTGQSATPWLQVQQQTNSQPPAKETSGTIETSSTHWLFPAMAIGIALIIVLLAVILTIVMMHLG